MISYQFCQILHGFLHVQNTKDTPHVLTCTGASDIQHNHRMDNEKNILIVPELIFYAVFFLQE